VLCAASALVEAACAAVAALAPVRSAFSVATSEDSVPTWLFRLSISACSGLRSVQPASATNAATAAILIPLELYTFISPSEVIGQTGRRCTDPFHVSRCATVAGGVT
jgi:hypothetical protein